jgi:methanogenic corrinoid protein MtbC1
VTAEPTQAAAPVRATIDAALAARDRAAAVAAATDAVESGQIDVLTLYDQVLIPLMVDTGTQWQAGSTRVWEEHFATATVHTIVDALYPAVAREAAEAPARTDSVLLACPPEEQHDLGLRMLADRFELAGWRTSYLGANTPVAEIVDAACALEVDLVVLSASTHYNRLLLRDVIDEVIAGLPGVKLVAGGAAFACDDCDWPQELLFDERIIEAGVGGAESAAPEGDA